MIHKPKYKILSRALESDLNDLYERGYRIKYVTSAGGYPQGGMAILLELSDAEIEQSINEA